MNRFRLHILFSLFLNLWQSAEARTFDRLILEINGKSYSQRQIELYIAIQNSLREAAPGKALLDSVTWQEKIERFRDEMLMVNVLENEVDLRQSLGIDQKSLIKAQQQLQKLLANDEQWRIFSYQYHIQEKEVREILLRIFEVQALLRSRQMPVASGQGVDLPFLDLDRRAAWFQQLDSQIPYRLYDGARVYQNIQPMGWNDAP